MRHRSRMSSPRGRRASEARPPASLRGRRPTGRRTRLLAVRTPDMNRGRRRRGCRDGWCARHGAVVIIASAAPGGAVAVRQNPCVGLDPTSRIITECYEAALDLEAARRALLSWLSSRAPPCRHRQPTSAAMEPRSSQDRPRRRLVPASRPTRRTVLHDASAASPRAATARVSSSPQISPRHSIAARRMRTRRHARAASWRPASRSPMS
jgi:hypothetical protein